ncbi:glycerol kinase [Acidocella sp. KAb 2-4]|uniref:FGGY-family carbohydrate kinase n=1 Tax=Acidocella sp. KAb 2-4 TaxID=2885158 RepID=UPI001D086E51|nr:FGGY family carbohydrate kinase [Acidocella sp. KAb 2-4]MCB5944064.1 glycerol kinase [Acidocella sp. KAb 2-4]
MKHGGPIIVGVDQGTTNTKAMAIDSAGRVLAQTERPIATASPQPGWVEQDALAMFANCVACIREVIERAGASARDVAGLGIANQTETLVIWDPTTAKPVMPAMVWQCRRGEAEIAPLRRPETAALIAARTGVDLDPTFTAAKLAWVTRHLPEIAAGLREGALLCGTVDCWLLWRLSGGRIYATEPGNASRTALFALERGGWDAELLALFGLELARLPETGLTARHYGETAAGLFEAEIPITAAMGDQQASLFGHGCFAPGDLKVTYGTGAFMWANAGARMPPGRADGLIRTIAWDLGAPTYALEGFVMSAGATLNWLARQFGLAGGGEAVVAKAREAADSHGVTLVPAFQGLGSPWWNADVRAVLSGMTEATSVAEICQAGLEAVCYQVRAALEGIAAAIGRPPALVRADGGPTRAAALMQLQADCLQIPLHLAAQEALTPFGVALMAGLGAGIWRGTDELRPLVGAGRETHPNPATQTRQDAGYHTWLRAVDAAIAATKPQPENAA